MINEIHTGNGNTLIVPNSERVKGIALNVLERMESVAPGRPKWVHLSGLVDGVQQISVGFWILDLDQEGAALSEFHEKLLQRLNEKGMSLAGPVPASGQGS